MRRRLSLVLVLALAACTPGGRAPSAIPTPTAVPPGLSLLLAATPSGGGVDLYRAASDHRAYKVGSLLPPAYAPQALAVTMAGADDPDICVLWAERRENPQLPKAFCYRPRRTDTPRTWGGTPVRGLPEDVAAIAMTHDGRSMAWLDPEPGHPELVDVVTGSFTSAAVTEQHRVPPGDRDAYKAQALLWAGAPSIVVTACCSDDRTEEFVIPVKGSGGWLAGQGKTLGYTEPDINWEDQVTLWASDRAAMLLELNPFAANGAPRSRVISVDRKAHRLIEVLVSPATDRQISYVVGGSRGVVYQTDVNDEGSDELTYLRLPGEPAGAFLIGLPENTPLIAQP